jgi:hypothetical protein
MFGFGYPINVVIFVGLLFALDAVLWVCGEYLERRRP